MIKPESVLWPLKLKDRLEVLLSYISTVISEPISASQNSDIKKSNEVNQVKMKNLENAVLCKFI